MKKALDIYTEVNNNRLWLLEGRITSREARDVVEKAMAFIDNMPSGEKRDILTDITMSLESMLDVTYVFWGRNGSYFEEDDEVLANECMDNGIPYDISTNPLAAVQAVWEKKGYKNSPFFPVDYFVA